MLLEKEDGTVRFSIFAKYPQVICSLSTRSLGDLNIGRLPLSNSKRLLDLLNISSVHLVVMNQVHACEVRVVNKNYANSIIKETDAIITKQKQLFLSVNFADCAPLFIYDPRLSIVAVAHSGWRGTILNISKHVIEQMIDMGSKANDIIVGVGPRIGGCCYTITKGRADKFLKLYERLNWAVYQENGQWRLDLATIIRRQLLDEGILSRNIDMPISCTSCQIDKYFSYRKDSKESFGEMLGVIGMKN